MKVTSGLAVLLLLNVACDSPPDAPQTRTDAILASTADTATVSVFLLDLRYDNGRSGICSATLVSPRVLLTAGHCIDPSREGALSVTVTATNKADDSMLQQSDFTAVVVQARHPQYSGEGAHDLGLLLLATAPSDVTVQPLLRTAPASWPGQMLRLVGYGRTSVGVANSGTRRTASVPVTAANAEALEFGSAGATGICSGDSGGPGFFTLAGVEYVAGVHSYGTSNQCGVGGDVRVDTNLAFIDGFVTSNDPPTCGADARCRSGCTPADVDCRCVDDGRCDVGCDRPDADCLPECAVSDDVCSADCPVDDPDCLRDGDVCQAADECASRLCVADPRGYSFCSRACIDDTACEREMICGSGLCRIAPSKGDGGPVQGGCRLTSGSSPALALLCFSALGRRRRRLR